MASRLDGIVIAVLGGDERELEVVRTLLRAGAELRLVGYPAHAELGGALRVPDPVVAVSGAQVVIAPMSNTDHEGNVKARLDKAVSIRIDNELLAAVSPETPFFIGQAKPVVRALAARYRLRLIETADVDEIAILNSIPTAEGAIQIAMQELPITIHGSRSVVLGFGRCGQTLARMLHALGAKTCVVARSPSHMARAHEMGLDCRHIMELHRTVPRADIVFNTVPSLVLTRKVLELLSRTSLIVDIASEPGGTDFEAARELGLKAILALGLPGKVAPKTAGRILARVLPGMISTLLGGH
ncbi:MAG: dipicolinate synthase subunit DpsA [Firmicutes bacterium]|nr:dipicolinate synthase subunit DpsA [Bacillota bacterium]